MNRLYQFLALTLAVACLVTPSVAFGQQTSVPETGRRLAPPMPPIRSNLPAEARGRRTAPPMPPIVTLPIPRVPTLPRPCFFNRFACDATHVYVTFGDSIALGATAIRGYVPRFEEGIEDSMGVRIRRHNLARSGMTVSELAAALAPNTPGRQALAQAHIVTWNIGGNDWRAARTLYKNGQCGGADNQDCLRSTLTSFQHSWDQIVQVMQETTANRPTLMRSMDIYNPYVREDLGTDSWSNDNGLIDHDAFQPYLQHANDHIAESLEAAHIPFAKISVVFNGPDGSIDPSDRGYMSADGFHPNDLGHQIIAQELLRFGAQDLPSLVTRL